MVFKNFVRDYLHFSKRDRIGVLLLIFLILVIYFLPLLFGRRLPMPLTTQPLLTGAADSLLAEPTPSNPYQSDNSDPQPSFTPRRLFRFDPNTIPAEGWQALGLPDRSIRTLLKYRSKGGHFYHPADLQKIWVLPPGFYDHVKDSISIAGASTPSPDHPSYTHTPFEKKSRIITPIGINTSDTSALIALPGIGSRLASRIITFRDRLGGFYSIDQVAETYGLPDSTFQKIKPYLLLDGETRKIHLNTATKDELKLHPYLRWKLANAIVEYRNLHGPFKSLTDLKNIQLIDEATFQKIAPYLSTD